MAELFVSESKAQVYGAVHDFLQSNTDFTKNTSKKNVIVMFFIQNLSIMITVVIYTNLHTMSAGNL